MRFTEVASSIVLLSIVQSGALFAGKIDNEARRTAAVSYQDLNLSKPEGLAALNRRLRSAVNQVCDDSGSGDLEQRNEARKCRKAALASAQQRISALRASGSQSAEVNLAVTQNAH